MSDAYTATLAADTIRGSSLYNKDLAPVSSERRTWRTYNYAALWISMSVNIPTYMLASGMIAGGMNWKQALFTVFLGNVLVLIPMLLNAHAGARYGIPFPEFARSGRVRLVWHSNLDRRGSDQRYVGRARAELGPLRVRSRDLLRGVLAAQRAGDSARHRNHSFSPRHLRAIPVADRPRAAPLGAQQSRRLRSDAGHTIEISKLRRILPLLHPVPHRGCRILGHGFAQYSRLYSIRAQPTRSNRRASSRPH